jgi:hypothetical protein
MAPSQPTLPKNADQGAAQCGNHEDRWDEAAGLSLDVVAYAAPQEHLAVSAAERERPTLDHIGIGVHKRNSQIYILAEGSEIVEQLLRTEPERFAACSGSGPTPGL